MEHSWKTIILQVHTYCHDVGEESATLGHLDAGQVDHEAMDHAANEIACRRALQFAPDGISAQPYPQEGQISVAIGLLKNGWVVLQLAAKKYARFATEGFHPHFPCAHQS